MKKACSVIICSLLILGMGAVVFSEEIVCCSLDVNDDVSHQTACHSRGEIEERLPYTGCRRINVGPPCYRINLANESGITQGSGLRFNLFSLETSIESPEINPSSGIALRPTGADPARRSNIAAYIRNVSLLC
ncbi:MAG: hypothetical protein JRI22_13770 [Deltaproteobacteria bacterium]|nr:hypothetical protein [Deltaproteobacteria bacterium]